MIYTNILLILKALQWRTNLNQTTLLIQGLFNKQRIRATLIRVLSLIARNTKWSLDEKDHKNWRNSKAVCSQVTWSSLPETHVNKKLWIKGEEVKGQFYEYEDTWLTLLPTTSVVLSDASTVYVGRANRHFPK